MAVENQDSMLEDVRGEDSALLPEPVVSFAIAESLRQLQQERDIAAASQALAEPSKEAVAAQAEPNIVTTDEPKVITIDDRIEQLCRLRNCDRKTVPQADTLVFLGYLGLENKRVERHLDQYFSNQPLIVESSRLKELHSPYFNKFLGGFYVTRRWKSLASQLRHYFMPFPIGTGYILNLTPDSEGMEAVQAIQDLSCSPVILQWRESRVRWTNHAALVCGNDECDDDFYGTSHSTEYSRIRHVKSIERFMVALQGHDPGFDTAAKVFTTVMVTKPWNIQAHHPLNDWVVPWFSSGSNVTFIQAAPETTLKMGEVLRNQSLCKDAFAILVGEAVLDAALHRDTDKALNKTTAYGRVRGDIEETWQDRIQHARNSFTDRVNEAWEVLIGEEMPWVQELLHVKKLRTQAEEEDKLTEFNDFLSLLKIFLQGALYRLTYQDYFPTFQESWDHHGGDILYPRNTEGSTWARLPMSARVYTVWFWKIVHQMRFQTVTTFSSTNSNLVFTDVRDKWGGGISRIYPERKTPHFIQTIFISELESAIVKCAPSEYKLSSRNGRLVRKLDEAGGMGTTPTQNAPSFRIHSTAGSAVYPECTYWICETALIGDAVHETCYSCGYAYCPEHVTDINHHCTRSAEHAALNQLSSHGEIKQADIKLPASIPSTLKGQEGVFHFEQHVEEHSDDKTIPINDVPTNDKTAQSKFHVLTNVILVEAQIFINSHAARMLYGVAGGMLEPLYTENFITQTLISLTEEETKFLPLWAEGLDDGTGGVFTDQLPAAEAAPVLGPGGRRITTPSEGSEFSFVSQDERSTSTINTSTVAHDGYRDTLPRGRVIASGDSDISSEAGWSYIQDSIETDGKGKKPAVYTPSESETAISHDGSESSYLDLHIGPGEGKSATQDNDATSGQSTPKAMSLIADGDDDDDDELDDIFYNLDEEEEEEDFRQDSSEEEDADDMDIVTSEDLEQESHASASAGAGAGQKANITGLDEDKNDDMNGKGVIAAQLAAKGPEDIVMKGIGYRYIEEEEDDLMTRL